MFNPTHIAIYTALAITSGSQNKTKTHKSVKNIDMDEEGNEDQRQI